MPETRTADKFALETMRASKMTLILHAVVVKVLLTDR